MAGWNDKSNGEAAPSGTDRQHPSKAAHSRLVPILPPEKAGPSRSPDPIARNPVDLDPSGAGAQVTELHCPDGSAGPTVDAPWMSNRLWGLRRPAEAAPSVSELLESVLRFKWTILLVFVLVSAPIIALIWTQIVPKYEARARIQVPPIIPRLAFKIDENGPIPFYESYVNTQVSHIRDTILPRVLGVKEVQETGWFRNPPRSLTERLLDYRIPALERLRDNVSIRPRPRTEIIDISFMDPNVKEAGAIVQAVVKEYLNYVDKTSSADDDKLYTPQNNRLKDLQGDIKGLEIERAKYVAVLKTDSPEELIAGKRTRLDEKEAALIELQSKITLLATQVTTPSKGPSDTSANIEEKPPCHADEEWRKLDFEVQRIHHQMTNGVWGERQVSDLKFAEDLQKQREVQLDEQWQRRLKDIARGYTADAAAGAVFTGATVPVAFQLTRAKEEEKLLSKELEEQRLELDTFLVAAEELETINNSLRQKRGLFDAIQQRQEQKKIEAEAPGVITQAGGIYMSARPTKDRRVTFTVMALLAGLGMGGGAGFLRASRNQAILAAKDMPEPMQDPLLGHIPAIHLKNAPGRLLFDEIEQNQILLNESIRVVRTALLSRLDGQGTAAVLVTSANEGTGKSSSTILLGKSIAQAGKKVLLIDADLHKMMLSTRFNLLDNPGLTESLCDKTMESLSTYATQTPGLDVMPAGKRSNRNARLEESANGAFRACIRRLFQQHGYDIILLDSPPILPVADAVILAGQVDGVIMVERENVSRRTDVMAALARLSATKGHLLGTVFVGSADRDHYGYGYSYRYRRGYYGSKVKRS